MNTLYSAKSVKLITENVMSSETYVTEISKGFKLNENATLVEVNESTQQLATLTSNTYINTTVNFDLNTNNTEFKLRSDSFENEYIKVDFSQELISIVLKNYTEANTQYVTAYYNYGYIGTSLQNLVRQRTSSSGTLNLSISSAKGVSDRPLIGEMLYVSYYATSPWEGTIDDTEAYLRIRWYPYLGIEPMEYRIPVRVQSMLGA